MSETEKSKGGRPRVGATPITVRLPPDMLAALDDWIARSSDPKPSRPEAVRRVLATGLGITPRGENEPAK